MVVTSFTLVLMANLLHWAGGVGGLLFYGTFSVFVLFFLKKMLLEF